MKILYVELLFFGKEKDVDIPPISLGDKSKDDN